MKHSRTLLAALLAVLLPAACSQPKDRFRLEGNISNISQAEFYVYCDDGTFDGIDTVRIDGGSFVYERTLTSPVVLTMLYPNFSRTYIVAEPGKTVKMTGDAAKLGEADISGTEENELLTDFRRRQAGQSDNNARLAATEFIRSNKERLAAVAVFKRYFAYTDGNDAATTLSLLGDLRRARPRDPALALLDSRLRAQLATAPGQQLPDFALRSLDGRRLTRADFSGRPMVVAFWASWSNESFALLAALHRIERAYGDRVGLVAVSADLDTTTCSRRAKRDSLAAPVVCDGQAFAGPAARSFGLRYVPGNLLVGADGRVVARDLTAAELERRVADLVK